MTRHNSYTKALYEHIVMSYYDGRVVYEPLDDELSISVVVDQITCVVDDGWITRGRTSLGWMAYGMREETYEAVRWGKEVGRKLSCM